MATTTTPQKQPSSSQIYDLISKHILQIVSSPSSADRRALYPSLYHPDVVVYDLDGTVYKGFDGLNGLLDRLVGKGSQFSGWEFRIDEKGVRRNGEFVWVGWEFGPVVEGKQGGIEVKTTGSDAILLDIDEQGAAKIKTLWVIVDGENDVKP